MSLTCAISNELPKRPVISPISGYIFERRLIEKYVLEFGTDPINGEELTIKQLIDVKTNPKTNPKTLAKTSVPDLLEQIQDEWDSIVLNGFIQEQEVQTARKELRRAYYQHEAASQCINRLTEELTVTRDALISLVSGADAATCTYSAVIPQPAIQPMEQTNTTNDVIQKSQDKCPMLPLEREIEENESEEFSSSIPTRNCPPEYHIVRAQEAAISRQSSNFTSNNISSSSIDQQSLVAFNQCAFEKTTISREEALELLKTVLNCMSRYLKNEVHSKQLSIESFSDSIPTPSCYNEKIDSVEIKQSPNEMNSCLDKQSYVELDTTKATENPASEKVIETVPCIEKKIEANEKELEAIGQCSKGKVELVDEAIKLNPSTSTKQEIDYSMVPYREPDYGDIMDILRKTKYPFEITSKERKYGPAPNWKGEPPKKNCQILLSNIPKDIFENRLICVFEEIGEIYELILHMDTVTAEHVGIAVLTFKYSKSAKKVMQRCQLITEKLEGIQLTWFSKRDFQTRMNKKHTCPIYTLKECNLCTCFILKKLPEINNLKSSIVSIKQQMKENSLLPIIENVDATNFGLYALGSFALEIAEIDAKTMQNVKRILNASQAVIAHKMYLDEQILLEIHQLLMPEGLGGKFKVVDNVIPSVYGKSVKTTTVEKMRGAIKELMNVANILSNSDSCHEVISATIVKLLSLNAHMFDDGNGKLSRILYSWFLKSKFPDVYPWIIFPSQEKLKYFSSIFMAQCSQGDLTPLLHYTFSVTQRSLHSYHLLLKEAFENHMYEGDAQLENV